MPATFRILRFELAGRCPWILQMGALVTLLPTPVALRDLVASLAVGRNTPTWRRSGAGEFTRHGMARNSKPEWRSQPRHSLCPTNQSAKWSAPKDSSAAWIFRLPLRCRSSSSITVTPAKAAGRDLGVGRGRPFAFPGSAPGSHRLRPVPTGGCPIEHGRDWNRPPFNPECSSSPTDRQRRSDRG